MGLFINDLQPFSVVDDNGFKEFVYALNPGYQLPSRFVVSKTLLPAMYEECVNKVQELVNCGKAFCITTDAWTSINTVSFIGVTAHFLDKNFNLHSVLLDCSSFDLRHTTENLAADLQRVCKKWKIENKVLFAVSDNAANIQKAIQSIGWKHMGCVAHTINLLVKDSLKGAEIRIIIEKVRETVTHFKRSNVSTEKLMKYQENLGKHPLKLILEVPTRWNSTYAMLERFIQLEEAVKSTVAIIEKQLPVLTPLEWYVVKELCPVLKPFKDVTETLSGEKYCTASLIIPVCNGLNNILKKLSKKQLSEPVACVVQSLNSGFHERLGNVESNNTLRVCTFLDPKFKQLAFSNPSIADNVKKQLMAIVAERITKESRGRQTKTNEYTDVAVSVNKGGDEGEDDDMSIWDAFDKTVAKAQPKGTSTSRSIIEIQRYLEEDVLPRHNNSLLWWQEHKEMLPFLSDIAQEKLCILATSVPCERLFSKAGQVLTERRNRLSDRKAEMILFLNANMK